MLKVQYVSMFLFGGKDICCICPCGCSVCVCVSNVLCLLVLLSLHVCVSCLLLENEEVMEKKREEILCPHQDLSLGCRGHDATS